MYSVCHVSVQTVILLFIVIYAVSTESPSSTALLTPGMWYSHAGVSVQTVIMLLFLLYYAVSTLTSTPSVVTQG